MYVVLPLFDDIAHVRRYTLLFPSVAPLCFYGANQVRGPASAQLAYLSKFLTLQIRLEEGLISHQDFKAGVVLLQEEMQQRSQ
jgi:hypothetical protein